MGRLKWLSYKLLGWPEPKVLWKVAGFKAFVLDRNWVVIVRDGE
jgi:hypothetical protein